jgi:hypothetical protein
MSKNEIVKSSVKPEEFIKQKIFIIRGQKVLLGQDLAELYQVPVKVLIQGMKRNQDRFPEDFVFQLNNEEFESLKSQIVTSKIGRGGQRYLPYAFTEHGVAMLSSVLNSTIAVQMNIFIIRAFIKMRESLDNYHDLAIKIGEIELNQLSDHGLLSEVYEVVKQLLEQPLEPKEKIGFRSK